MIPSGIAGLIVTISPFWMVGVEALLPGVHVCTRQPSPGWQWDWLGRRCSSRRTRGGGDRSQAGDRVSAAPVRHGGVELRVDHPTA